MMKKAMGDKGYFDQGDWEVACLCWPNLHMTITQIEQLFSQLLQEGKIEALGLGRYCPNTTEGGQSKDDSDNN
jgi:hypothetical protein